MPGAWRLEPKLSAPSSTPYVPNPALIPVSAALIPQPQSPGRSPLSFRAPGREPCSAHALTSGFLIVIAADSAVAKAIQPCDRHRHETGIEQSPQGSGKRSQVRGEKPGQAQAYLPAGRQDKAGSGGDTDSTPTPWATQALLPTKASYTFTRAPLRSIGPAMCNRLCDSACPHPAPPNKTNRALGKPTARQEGHQSTERGPCMTRLALWI